MLRWLLALVGALALTLVAAQAPRAKQAKLAASGARVLKPSGKSSGKRRTKLTPKAPAVKALRKKLATVQQNKEAVKAQLKATTKQATKVRVDLNLVDGQLDVLERRYDITVAELAVDRKKQVETEALLARDQAELGRQREEVRARIRQMYMQGNAAAVSVLLGATTSGDAISRGYFVSRVLHADSNALQAYRDLVDRTQAQKAEADQVLADIKRRETDQRTMQVQLQQTRLAKQETLNDLESNAQELQSILDQLERDENAVKSAILSALARGGSTTRRHFSGRLMAPVGGHPGSPFGMRFHPIKHQMLMHYGEDFPVPTGTPIGSAADGVVISATYMRGYGNCVIIDHGGGIATVYAHCSRLLVATGDRVHRGQHIANSGATGLATGPHLHFEVHVNGVAVNPAGWL